MTIWLDEPEVVYLRVYSKKEEITKEDLADIGDIFLTAIKKGDVK